MQRVVMLDMDGVIADFMGAALRLHGREGLFDEPASKGVWDTEKLLGISANQFWKPINATPDFWPDLPKTAEADEIVALAESLGEVTILTAPALGDECFLGKRQWLRRHYPKYVSRLAFAKEKHLYASPRHLLIDDKDSNCTKFREAGGRAILVPRSWNSEWQWADIAMDVIRSAANQEEVDAARRRN